MIKKLGGGHFSSFLIGIERKGEFRGFEVRAEEEMVPYNWKNTIKSYKLMIILKKKVKTHERETDDFRDENISLETDSKKY